ncbi:hypothetical protein ScPMuIL_000388 [Solemya velum]
MADVCAEAEPTEASDLNDTVKTEKPPDDDDDVTEENSTSNGTCKAETSDSGAATNSGPGAKLNPSSNPFASKPHLKADMVSTPPHQSHTSGQYYNPPQQSHISDQFYPPPHQSRTSDRFYPHQMPVGGSNISPYHKCLSKEGFLGSTTDPLASPAKCLLRPSALSAQVQNLTQKDSDEKIEKENQEQPVKEESKENVSHPKEEKVATSENYFVAVKEEERSDEEESSEKNYVFGQNLAGRVTGVTTPTPTTPNGSEKAFVFGENIADRVVQGDKSEDEDKPSDSAEETTPEKTQTLEESAREYQAKHEQRTELKEVEVKTGEENESNVLQAVGKLYLFDGPTQTYVERGRGQLRLNDMSAADSTNFHSRLVMRTQGSLRVILNTKIWAGMTVERASQKSVRLTATDSDEGVKVFLIVTNPKDTENLLRAVDWRIQQLRIQEADEEEKSAVPSTTEKRKAESFSPISEVEQKRKKKTEDAHSGTAPVRREESDSSVLDPETDASSESCTSSLTMRSESD